MSYEMASGFVGNTRRASSTACGLLLRGAVGSDAEVAKEPVVEVVDEPVHRERLAARPRVSDDGGLADVRDLFDHVELAQTVETLMFGE
jgi:hypothetical protein